MIKGDRVIDSGSFDGSLSDLRWKIALNFFVENWHNTNWWVSPPFAKIRVPGVFPGFGFSMSFYKRCSTGLDEASRKNVYEMEQFVHVQN